MPNHPSQQGKVMSSQPLFFNKSRPASRPIFLFSTLYFAASCIATATAQAQQSTPVPPVTVETQKMRPAAKKKRQPRVTTARPVATEQFGSRSTQETFPPGTIIDPSRQVEKTTAGAVQGIRALSASSSTRTDTAIERIPNAIHVVQRQLIK